MNILNFDKKVKKNVKNLHKVLQFDFFCVIINIISDTIG